MTHSSLAPLQVWPVIHLADEGRRKLVRYNVEVARATRCPGVMLIHMRGDDEATLAEAHWVRQTYPDLKVGVNLLATPADQALLASLRAELSATWSDSPGVSSQGVSAMGHRISAVLRAKPSHLFFGSVAFKYQPAEADPAAAAVQATRVGMLATTSGTATGSAPELGKLAAMRAALGPAPLAVASGITPENVLELGAPLTHLLVATGISRSFHELDPARLHALVAACARVPR